MAGESALQVKPREPKQGLATGARFEQIFHRFAPYVRRVVPRMGISAGDVDDVVQEVFVAVYRGLPGFAERSSEKTWVYGICIRICSNHRKRAYHRRERPMAIVPEQGRARDPESALSDKSLLAALDATLDLLPESQRAAFVLHEIEELSVLEIAQAMGCPKFTVYARLRMARLKVRSEMNSLKRREMMYGKA